MKKHPKLQRVYPFLVIAFLILMFAAIFLNAQSPLLTGVDPAQVEVISAFDGNTGVGFEIRDEEDIAFVVEQLQSLNFQKDGISVNYSGFRYRLAFLDAEGNTLDQLIVNAPERVRKDPFFYTPVDGDLQALCDFLQAMEEDIG